jgi:hypothetical protein
MVAAALGGADPAALQAPVHRKLLQGASALLRQDDLPPRPSRGGGGARRALGGRGGRRGWRWRVQRCFDPLPPTLYPFFGCFLGHCVLFSFIVLTAALPLDVDVMHGWVVQASWPPRGP